MEAVIKVGGSLAENPEALKALCVELKTLARKHAFVVVPGGGRFADAVRELDLKLHLPALVSHRLAILAMDQYGIVLSSIILGSVACDSLEEARRVSEAMRVPVFLPSRLMSANGSGLEASWEVTSDSISAYIATKLGVSKVVFVTDVDGVFTADPKIHPEAKLLSEVSVNELLSHGARTSVDSYLPKLLSTNPMECFVVNGLYPERLHAVLSGKATVCTHIQPVLEAEK